MTSNSFITIWIILSIIVIAVMLSSCRGKSDDDVHTTGPQPPMPTDDIVDVSISDGAVVYANDQGFVDSLYGRFRLLITPDSDVCPAITGEIDIGTDDTATGTASAYTDTAIVIAAHSDYFGAELALKLAYDDGHHITDANLITKTSFYAFVYTDAVGRQVVFEDDGVPIGNLLNRGTSHDNDACRAHVIIYLTPESPEPTS